MTHLGLFEGIGGFSLAARWMGWQTLAWCEWNDFGQRVLRHHFPHAEGFGDITKTDFTSYHGKIDILTGGFPCQPYSSAGKRLGKEDERHLWPHMLRAVREVSPRYVVGENVLGLVNWSAGLVFEEVQTDLEAQGYEVLPFILPAAGVGAPHRRDRIWFIAHANSDGFHQCDSEYAIDASQVWVDALGNFIEGLGNEYATNSDGYGLRGSLLAASDDDPQRHRPLQHAPEHLYQNQPTAGETNWEHFPTQSPLCGGDDGLPDRLDGITVSRWRKESIKAYGNAIVPQVALQIFRAIALTEDKLF